MTDKRGKVVHHLLSLYGTGSQPEYLQKAFDDNASYQIRAKNPTESVVEELKADYAANAPRYLGKGKHYADFLRFFQLETERLGGWQNLLTHYVFREDDGNGLARDMMGRLFAGFLHPIIQLMFGMEWGQPAIVAEGLAQAAVHDNKLAGFFDKAESRAEEKKKAEGDMPHKSLVELIEEIGSSYRSNENGEEGLAKLARSAKFSDPNKIYEGVIKRASDEAVEFVSNISVRDGRLEERTAEMIHTAAYVAVGAASHPPNVPKLDFFLM